MSPHCVRLAAMAKPKVRVPEPVKEEAEAEAEEKDTTLGEVIRDWMEDSHRLQETGSDVL